MAELTAGAAPRFDRVRFVMGDSDSDATGVMDTLHSRGLRRTVSCNAKEQLFEALNSEIVDVLMYDYDLLSHDFVDVIQSIRRKVHGKNPFLIVIATVRDSAFDTVRQLFRAGVDDLIRKPVSTDRLFESLNTFTRKRQPFLVSYDYVGPTRRSRAKGAASPDRTQLIRVPNTLRSRAVEGASDAELERIVTTAVARIDNKRIESCGVEVEILAQELTETYTKPSDDNDVYLETRGALHRIELIADDLRERCKDSSMARVGDLATMLIAITQRILRKPHGRALVEIQLLGKLAIAIRRAVSVERDSVRVMQEIATTIATYTRQN
jgi:DNA-binding response OmpR family regulator